MARNQSDILQPRPGDMPADSRIGRYRIHKVVGRGGMGTVYSAFDEDTKRDVAIKVLLPGLPDLLKERFLAECEAEAKIRHPHVMPVYDRGTTEDDRLYFVMELVYEPITLSDVVDANMTGLTAQRWPRLRPWAQPMRLIQDVVIPICEGVHAANHEYGIFHRDIKPDNVLIDVRTRRASLIDFGICYRRGQALEARKIIGTPRFLSPEQASGKIHERTDVFGCGALVYYVFTGRPPIESSSPMRTEERAKRVGELKHDEEIAKKAGDGDRAAELAARRTALEDPDFRTVDDMIRDGRSGLYGSLPDHVPGAVRAIIAKAMAKEPEDRYADSAELAADLKAWIAGGPVKALSEQTTTGAAVAAAGRTMRRHVRTALWVVLGLVIGLPIGARLLSGEDAGTTVRTEDVQGEVRQLGVDLEALAQFDASSIEGALRWRTLRADVTAAKARVATIADEDARGEAESALQAVDAALPYSVLVFRPHDRNPWEVRSVIDHRGIVLEPGANSLPPGPYWVHGRRAWIPFLLPLTTGEAPPTTLEIDVELPQGGVPPDMIYVPAGPPAEGEADLPAFFLGVSEVTYLEYAEWIDEIDAAQRKARLPPEGFVVDTNMPGRYLADPDYADRPVTNVRPEDAEAYAAWRTEIYGVPVHLPTEAEWRRAAGGALLRPEGSVFFRAQAEKKGRILPDRSPYGARNMLGGPPEIVTTADGFAIMGTGPGAGIPPSKAALERREPVAADARAPAGFRLVQHLPTE